MSNLEEYIRGHAAEFDTEVPSAKAEKRFLDRWGHRRLMTLRFALPAFAAAAALAVLVILPKPDNGNNDWLRDAEDTPEGIYLSYIAQVSKAWEEAGPDEFRSDQLRSLTDEPVPLADQLPDELSDSEKTLILREHYNTLLDGVYNLLQKTK
jgi:hypothetical protein